MPLLPVIASALLRRNKEFDPNDPRSLPYAEKRTGFGRFFSALAGPQANPEALNSRYAADRAEDERRFQAQRGLQESSQKFQKERQEEGWNQDWKLLHSRLSNDAVLRQWDRDQQSAVRREDIAQRTADREASRSQGLFETTGSWDPIEQQDILRRIRQQSLMAPRSLGANAFWNPANSKIYERVGGGWNLNKGDFDPSSWQEMNLDGSEMPTGNTGGGAGLQLSPEEQALLLGGGGGGGGGNTNQSTITQPVPQIGEEPSFFSKLFQTGKVIAPYLDRSQDSGYGRFNSDRIAFGSWLQKLLQKRQQQYPTTGSDPVNME